MPKIIEDQDVFEAVLQTIAERGYAGATTKQMAEAAGVSEVTLFRKYESKPQLVRLAISAIAERADFSSAVRYTGDLRADLLRVLHAYQGSVARRGIFFVVLFSELSRHPELTDALDVPLQLYAAVGDLLDRYQEEGVLHEEHPLHAVAALLGPLIYTSMLHSAVPGESVPPLDLERHVTGFLEGRLV